MTTTIDKNNPYNTELQSLLEKICIMENVDNIGFIRQQVGPNKSWTNLPFDQIGTQQINSKIKYLIIK